MPFELDDDWFAGIAETRTMTERERCKRVLEHKPMHEVFDAGRALKRDAKMACISYRFGLERTLRCAEWFGKLDNRRVVTHFDDDLRDGLPAMKSLLEYERCLPKLRSMAPANITIDSIGDTVNLDVDPVAKTVRISAGNTSHWSIRE